MNPNERLKEVRKHAGLTQEKFGEKVGLKQSQIKDIETAKQKVNPELAEIIEINFSISGWWLLTGKGEMLLNEQKENEKNQEFQTLRTIIDARDILEHHISEREIDILQAYRSLPKERQELIWHKVKAEEIEHGIKTKPQDAKTA